MHCPPLLPGKKEDSLKVCFKSIIFHCNQMLALSTLLHYLSIDFYRLLQVIYLRKFNSSLAHQMSLFVLFGNLNK